MAVAGTCDSRSSRCHRSLGGAACPLSSPCLGKKVSSLRGIVIMARSVINIHRGALLITLLINCMCGAPVVGEGYGESGCALVGMSAPCQICLPLAESILPCRTHSLARSSAKPQPLGLIAAGLGRVPLHGGTSHHSSATQGTMFCSALARTRGDRVSVPHG